MKDADIPTITAIAAFAKQTCDAYGAKLIINDHPDIAALIGATGTHVGIADGLDLFHPVFRCELVEAPHEVVQHLDRARRAAVRHEIRGHQEAPS